MFLHQVTRALARSRLVFAASCLLGVAALNLCAQNGARERRDWDAPVPPFRIVGNVYYVGARGVSSFLIASSGGLIVLDNMLQSGRVLNPADPASRIIAALNDRIQRDERVENVLLPIRDGIMLAYRR